MSRNKKYEKMNHFCKNSVYSNGNETGKNKPDLTGNLLSKWKAWGIHIGTVILDYLYPPCCPICDRIIKSSLQRCCDDCRRKLPWNSGAVCMKCGKPVGSVEQAYCQDCRKISHHFDQGAAAFIYDGELRKSIYRMKFENRRDYLDFYAESMAAVCERHLHLWQPDLILPVPMHKSRRRKRGYNQSELLAVRLGRLTGIPVERRRLKCIRKAAAQKRLDRSGRLKNLYGCFEVSGSLSDRKRILIVDDVYTTGSTLDEVSRVLKKAGAEHIFFIVLCTGKGKKTVCTDENLCYTEVYNFAE